VSFLRHCIREGNGARIVVSVAVLDWGTKEAQKKKKIDSPEVIAPPGQSQGKEYPVLEGHVVFERR